MDEGKAIRMSLKVLFVDDEPFFARNYIASLEQQGFAVHYVSRADEAIGELSANPDIRAIVLDVMMPMPSNSLGVDTHSGLDTGLWLLKQIRSCGSASRTPVLVLTNRSQEAIEDTIRSLDASRALVRVASKIDVGAAELPDRVKALIESAESSDVGELQ